MDPKEIRAMVSKYEHLSSFGTEPYFQEIKSLGASVIPFFVEAFPNSKQWRQRASFLYRATNYARTSEKAVELGLMALSDRSKEVRYRAYLLLACSLKTSVLPYLDTALQSASVEDSDHIKAAIDAIQSQNHHYFVDREHSGFIKLNFGG